MKLDSGSCTACSVKAVGAPLSRRGHVAVPPTRPGFKVDTRIGAPL